MTDGGRVITGTMLRDVSVCERRAWHDANTDGDARDRVASFVQLLWAQGVAHEEAVLAALPGAVDLRDEAPRLRRRLTLRALATEGVEHVLGGEIACGDLLGRPDVIARVDGAWVVGDVKAGSPFMPDGRRPKREYAMQIGLYARILDGTGLGAGDRAFVIGADGGRVMFDLDAPWGDLTVRAMVADGVELARSILARAVTTRGAASAVCGLCHWRTVCRVEFEAADDLTLVPELGREARRAVEQVARDRAALAGLDLASVERTGGRSSVPGVGMARLARFRDRARLQRTPGASAYARVPLGLSRARLEHHLDIEADPSRGGLVYLHGVWERSIDDEGVERTRFVHFFADGPDGERRAFADAWAFLTSAPDAMVYYYSKFERTSYRALQRRHPSVCAAEDVEAFFSSPRVIDLYGDVVRPSTEWPTTSYGIKALAKHLGFGWAAEDASGASSIAWYDQFVRTGDSELRERIIDYNRSDCIASAVVLDGLIALPVGAPSWPTTDRSPGRGGVAGSNGGQATELGVDVHGGVGHRGDGDAGPGRAALDDASVEDKGSVGTAPSDIAGAGSTVGAHGLAISRAPYADRHASVPPAIYATPAMRVCLDPIAPDTGDGIGSGILAAYAHLLGDLPLKGGDALRPSQDGGVELCRALRASMPWMMPAIDLLERQLRVALWAGRPWLQFRPMCLVGPSGVGKSRLAREVGRLAGVSSAQLDLGGMHDAAAIAPKSRGWSTSRPAWPVQMINALGQANPVLALDEIEKAGGSARNGRPLQALLAMLEPSTAAVYLDTSLMARVDLSAICWIATANDASSLPRPLRSRLDVVEVPAPGPEHFDVLVAGVLADAASRWGVPVASMPPLPRRAAGVLRVAFAQHRSVRLLRRHLNDVLSAILPSPRTDLN